jgi:plastocyanin
MQRIQWVQRTVLWGIVIGVTAIAVACGGSDSPTSPSPPAGGGGGGGGGGGTPAPNTLTLTVTANGVTASGTTLAAGGTITWVNQDNRAHDMSSDPHPQHTDCPGMNAGDLNPGQQRTVGPVSTVRSCGYHDHLNPGSTSLQGRITVQ